MTTALELFKLDLGIQHSKRDIYFLRLLKSAESELKRRGIPINLEENEDLLLVVDFALWRYRNRTTDVPLAKNIQKRIRDRIIKERAK